MVDIVRGDELVGIGAGSESGIGAREGRRRLRTAIGDGRHCHRDKGSEERKIGEGALAAPKTRRWPKSEGGVGAEAGWLLAASSSSSGGNCGCLGEEMEERG